MAETYGYTLDFPSTSNATPTASAAGKINEPYVYVPPTLSLTLAGPGAATTSLPLQFPVASVITSGSVVRTSIGFETFANPAEISSAASAARNFYLHSSDVTTNTSSAVPTGITTETAPLIVSGSTVVTTPFNTVSAPASTITTGAQGSSASGKATTTKAGSGACKFTSIKKTLAAMGILAVAINML